MSDFIPCAVCEKPELEHHDTQHLYTPQGSRVDTSQFKRKRPKGDDEGDDKGNDRRIPASYTQTPFDPVLRQALLDAGVLTIEQLDEARKKIELLTNTVTGGRGNARGSGS